MCGLLYHNTVQITLKGAEMSDGSYFTVLWFSAQTIFRSSVLLQYTISRQVEPAAAQLAGVVYEPLLRNNLQKVILKSSSRKFACFTAKAMIFFR